MQAYNQLQSTNPAQAALIYQIASQPQAVWLYGDGDDDDCHGGPPHGQWRDDDAAAPVNKRPVPQA